MRWRPRFLGPVQRRLNGGGRQTGPYSSSGFLAFVVPERDGTSEDVPILWSSTKDSTATSLAPRTHIRMESLARRFKGDWADRISLNWAFRMFIDLGMGTSSGAPQTQVPSQDPQTSREIIEWMNQGSNLVSSNRHSGETRAGPYSPPVKGRHRFRQCRIPSLATSNTTGTFQG